ncbi:MAG: rRNA maturation RNase YbeY [Patescibacteria group bacterium]
MENSLSILNQTKGKLPNLPFVLLKNDILGEKYSLSIAFIGEKKSKEINFKYRGKNNPTNILSFPLSKTEGEILICPNVVKTQLKLWNKNYRDFTGFLVIHGMLHLKGMEHGAIMEKAEKKYDQKYFYRNRRGNNHDENSSGRIPKRTNKS